jgi:hypothetical protein
MSQKNRSKTRVTNEGENKGNKNQIRKRTKGNKMLSQRSEKGWEKT